MNIAIIGTGGVGAGLARSFTGAGHRVALAGRSSKQVEAAATATGAIAAASPTAAAALSDVVILAVPWDAVEDVAGAIRPVVNGKVIVDVTNPAKADWSGPLFAGADSGAEHLAAWLPEARVVKAFNTVLAGNIGTVTDGGTLDGFVAGDDAAAKESVLELAAAAGLNPIDAGPLTAARMLESLAWLNISLNQQPGWSWRTGWKLVGAPESRAA